MRRRAAGTRNPPAALIVGPDKTWSLGVAAAELLERFGWFAGPTLLAFDPWAVGHGSGACSPRSVSCGFHWVLSVVALLAVALDAAVSSALDPSLARSAVLRCAHDALGARPEGETGITCVRMGSSQLGAYAAPAEVPLVDLEGGSAQAITAARAEVVWWSCAAIAWVAVLVAVSLRGRWAHGFAIVCQGLVVASGLVGWMGAAGTAAVVWSVFRAGWAWAIVVAAKDAFAPPVFPTRV
ncbi:hypothetical protein FNF27_00881 [Cafeteria roenbergensis]|uniref:Uncharacterized protein n=1 Tax=Cafeteria roenbergensis TaxID=33653 RepID=A0A5A8EJC4_CAFRO|nr:hypothetical protein FNF27_00881 [Cafeteria roenbergensis]|mmetsp:Transcript_6997/g.28384  ORF Transcript_6997/g.28384 Transcript_6997/m.28384 type:complete len:239 (-) Transcript_6997:15-731(-)